MADSSASRAFLKIRLAEFECRGDKTACMCSGNNMHDRYALVTTYSVLNGDNLRDMKLNADKYGKVESGTGKPSVPITNIV